jgi:hypothetical protein
MNRATFWAGAWGAEALRCQSLLEATQALGKPRAAIEKLRARADNASWRAREAQLRLWEATVMHRRWREAMRKM